MVRFIVDQRRTVFFLTMVRNCGGFRSMKDIGREMFGSLPFCRGLKHNERVFWRYNSTAWGCILKVWIEESRGGGGSATFQCVHCVLLGFFFFRVNVILQELRVFWGFLRNCSVNMCPSWGVNFVLVNVVYRALGFLKTRNLVFLRKLLSNHTVYLLVC